MVDEPSKVSAQRLSEPLDVSPSLIEYPIGKSPRPPALCDAAAARGSVGRSEKGGDDAVK